MGQLNATVIFLVGGAIIIVAVLVIAMMRTLAKTPSNFSLTPLDVSTAAAVVAYLVSVAVIRYRFWSPESADALLGLPLVAIAGVVVVAVHVALYYRSAHRVGVMDAQRDPSTFPAEEQMRQRSVAANARWYHHALGAISGSALGVFLAFGLAPFHG